MEEKSMKISLLKSRDEADYKYKDLINKDFDYEKNVYKENENINSNKFDDSLASRYYLCENICFMKRNLIKGLVSKKKIRMINKDFDLDLV